MTKAEYIERYGIDAYNRRLEYYRNYYNSKYREIQLEWHKEYNSKPEVKVHCKEYMKEYRTKDLNSDGKPKVYIRNQSKYILFEQRKHTKLNDYQIHHAFGYNDPSKFIYIPKSLHIKIHQYLRDNNIDADSNHYKYISTMINECEEYIYISV